MLNGYVISQSFTVLFILFNIIHISFNIHLMQPHSRDRTAHNTCSIWKSL